jgi:hypothetical protein
VIDLWTVYGYDPFILCLSAGWLIWHAYEAVQDTRALVRHIRRYRRFPVPWDTGKS